MAESIRVWTAGEAAKMVTFSENSLVTMVKGDQLHKIHSLDDI